MLKFLIGTSIGLILLTGQAMATCSTYPYTLANGTTADASQVMANLNCAALLDGSTLTGASLTGATLSSATLTNATLSSATLSSASLSSAALTGTTTLPGSGAISSGGTLTLGGSPVAGAVITATGNKSGDASSELLSFINTAPTHPDGIEINNINSSSGDLVTYFVEGDNSSGTQFRIYSNGNMVNANNSYGAISDIREKRLAHPMDSVVDRFRNVQFWDYHFNAESDADPMRHGVVAQYIEPQFPWLVSETPWGGDKSKVRKTVDYMGLSIITAKATQENIRRTDAADTEIAALKTQVDQLVGTVHKLQAVNDNQSAEVQRMKIDQRQLREKRGSVGGLMKAIRD